MSNTNLISHDDLEMLLENKNNISMSIYMPTESDDPKQCIVRLKNIIYQAEKKIIESGIYSNKIKESVLRPLNALTAQESFWKNLSEGLAIFASQDILEYYKLPIKFEEIVHINHNFYMKPLFPLFRGDSKFYILSLGKKNIRLLLSEGAEIKEVYLSNMPHNFYDVYQDTESQIENNQIDEKILLQNFYQINDSIADLLHRQNIPLLLACDIEYCSIYKKANSYHYLIENIINADPDAFSAGELQQMAQQILDPISKESQKNELNKFINADYKNDEDKKTSHSIEEIVPSSYYGQIDTLFITENTHQWGRFESGHNTIFLGTDERSEYIDLIDFIAVKTYINGGKVYVLKKEEMPNNYNITALLRYPLSMKTKVMVL